MPGEAKPLEPGKGKQGCVYYALIELLKARLDIAAEVDGLKVRAQALHLSLAAERRASHHCARRQRGERLTLGADEGIAHIAARQHGGDGSAWRKLRGQVLHGVHGDIDPLIEQGLVDLLGEQPLAAEVAQRLVADAVAGGGDGLKRDGVLTKAMRSDQESAHMVRLPQSERASARADEELAIRQVLDSIAQNRKEGIILFNRPGLTL